MIVSEDELYETQCPVPLWMCDKCNTTLSLSTECDCRRWKSRMNNRSKKLLRLMRGMSDERPLGFDEIAKACGLPRMSVKSFLSRQACKPEVDWRGMRISFIRTSEGYKLSRKLTEEERKFEVLRWQGSSRSPKKKPSSATTARASSDTRSMTSPTLATQTETFDV